MAEAASMLEIRDLNVFYGHSHALQGVNLTLESGVLSVVGRNGMGKTTLCQAIMGLVSASSGSIRLAGRALNGLSPTDIARMGIGYVPQGRRLWPTLSVDEHLKLVEKRGMNWSIDRVYSTFPRLAERRDNLGSQLSGGEQQMLAISRALLLNPKLLVMDEPTEGLAPVIVQQLEDMLSRLGRDGGVDVLVIEQNIGVACAVAEKVAIMVNGRINRIMESSRLSNDRDLQQALLGVGRHAHDSAPETPRAVAGDVAEAGSDGIRRIYMSNPKTPTRWSRPVPVEVIEGSARTSTADSGPQRMETPLRHAAKSHEDAILVVGTFDTKGRELNYIGEILKNRGLMVRMVDISTSGKPSGADVPPHEVAAFHPRGTSGVFTGDRGSAVLGMTEAFLRWIISRDSIAGAISAGGSGATAMVCPGLRTLDPGIPKLVVSTVASGDVQKYVGESDITIMNAVADIQGLNSITSGILANGAHAIAGMVAGRMERPRDAIDRKALGITMFGVTTPLVRQVSQALETHYDVLVFHATGTGGRAMEDLMDRGRLSGILDLTTTEICDMVAGGVFPADDTRFDAAIRSGLPYIGACGALDMVNFGPPESMPDHYRGRLLYPHNPQVTLMRTNAGECAKIGRWIGEKLNQMNGPTVFLIPEGGVSQLSAPGQPFHDPTADAALFESLEETVRQTSARRLIRSPHNINDPEFASLVLNCFHELHASPARATGA